MAEAYSEIIKDPKQTPDWLVEGATNLLPKREENMDPLELQANSMSANHLQDPDISHHRQAVQSSGERSHHDTRTERRKEILLWMQGSVDDQQCYLKNCKKRKKNLSTAWMDYKKAFDSVTHPWILKCLQVYKINPVLTNIHRRKHKPMEDQHHTSPQGRSSRETGPFRIKRGIFQGDSLSPLLFTMSLNPLS